MGFLKLHTSFKTDLNIKRDQSSYQADPPNIDAMGQNLQGDLALDFGIGYKRRRWSLNYFVENLKLMQLVTPKKDDFAYGSNPLMGLHGDYRLKYKGFTVRALAGAHQRSGHYAWGEGFYLGSEVGASAFKGRLGFFTTLTMDQEHWNAGLKLKGLIGQLDFLWKMPKKSSIDGVKLSSFHSLSLRLFF